MHGFLKMLLCCALLAAKLAFAWGYSCSSASLATSIPPKLAISTASENYNVFFYGTITITQTNCTNISGDGNVTPVTYLATNGSGKNLTAAPGIVLGVNGTPTATVTAGPCTLNGYNASQTFPGGQTYATVTWNQAVGKTCSFLTVFPITLFMNTGLGGTIGSVGANITSATGNVGGAAGWAWYSGNGTDLALSSTFATVATSCTLSTNNVVVSLPKVATGSLAVAGNTVGRTAFTLSLAGCTNIGATYSANITWSFAQSGSYASVIANGAATPAANVGVQLLDHSFNPINNYAVTTLANVSSAGSYSTTYYAQYYATGVAGAGAVTGLAQLTLSYD